jgi:hypothetical protein
MQVACGNPNGRTQAARAWEGRGEPQPSSDVESLVGSFALPSAWRKMI